jgi:ketosteroid isomerase-like protein
LARELEMEMNRAAGTTSGAVEAVVDLPDLTDDDDDDVEDEYAEGDSDEEDEDEEEEGGHYKYKNQSYENGTRDKSNYVALLGPQVRPSPPSRARYNSF